MTDTPTSTPDTSAPTAGSAGDYRVELSAYAGPLDLLLYLVKRHEIDLNDIPIAKLTEQYLDHLRAMQELRPTLDVEQAGEFLVMAATLVEIKSRMIAPQDVDAEEQDDPTSSIETEPTVDPRLELVHQLLAYKRIKDAAGALDRRYDDWQARFPASSAATPVEEDQGEAALRDVDLDDADVMDLCAAFGRILDSVGRGPVTHDVEYDDTPISLHAEDIHDRLKRDGPMSLREILSGRGKRSELIGLFLATLELVRQHRVRVVQASPGEDIRLELRPDAPAEVVSVSEPDEVAETDDVADAPPVASASPDPQDLDAFDWPDAAARKRAERRKHLRDARAAGEDIDEGDEDVLDADDED